MRLKGEKGNFYILVVMICTILTILSHMLISTVSSEYLKCRQMEEKSVAFNLAEAGIEKAIWHLKKGNIDYKGEDSLLGNGRFRVKVDEKDDRIFITSTGYIPNQKEIRVKVIIRKEDLKVVLWE